MNGGESIGAREPVARIVPALLIIILLSIPAVLLATTQDMASPHLIYGSVAVIVYVFTLFDIRIGLAVTMAAIGLSPEFAAGGIGDLRVEDFLIPVLLFSWITRREESRPTNLRGPILFYLIITFVSAATAGIMESAEPGRGMLISLKFLEYFVLLSLVVNIIRTDDEIRFFTWLFVLMGILAAAYGFVRGWGPASQPGYRIAGPVGETANIFAGYLTLIISLCIGLFLHSPRVQTRILLSAAMLFLFYVSLLTYSRTGYVALFAGTIIFGLFKRRQLLAVVLILAVIFPIIAPESVWQRASTIGGIVLGDSPPSFDARIQAWRAAEKDIFQSPVFGNGPGYLPFGWLDNEYVRVLVDLGFLGLTAFLWLLYRMLILANRTYNAAEEQSLTRGIASGYFIGLLCMIVHSWGATSFTSIRTMEAFMIFTGILVAQYNRITIDQEGSTGQRADGHRHAREPLQSPTLPI